MPHTSWFDPDRLFKHPEDYAEFVGRPYDALCELMTARFERESASDARIQEEIQFRDELEAHLSSVDVFDQGPSELAARIASGFFRMFYLEQTLLTLSAGRADFFEDIVEVRGLDRIKAIAAEDGGVQFALAHHGPHFLVHLLLAKLGIECSVGGAMTNEFGDGHRVWADRLNIPLADVEAVDFSDNFGRAMAALVASGKSLTLYPEYSRSKRLGRHTTTFLGQTVHLPTGVARLAKMTQRRLVGVRMVRLAPYRYRIEFGPALSVGTADDQWGVPEAAAEILRFVEEAVIAEPENWEGWRYFRIMKANALQVMLRNLAAERRRKAS